MDYSALHFSGPLSPKVMVKFAIILLNFSIFSAPHVHQGKALLFFFPQICKGENDQRKGEMRFYMCGVLDGGVDRKV